MALNRYHGREFFSSTSSRSAFWKVIDRFHSGFAIAGPMMRAPTPGGKAQMERPNQRGQLSQLITSLAAPKPTFPDRAAVAYVLHNVVYCALVNAVEQISRTFENHVAVSELPAARTKQADPCV